MQKEIESWIKVAQPWVEEEYGSLPEFVVKPGRVINETPWRIDPEFRRHEWVFRYYPKWFKKKWFPDQAGYAVHALTHDLIHLLQLQDVVDRFSYMKRLPKIIALFASLHFMEWGEGSAELCTYQVGFKRVESKLNNELLTPNTFLEMLQTDVYKGPLTDFLSQYLASSIMGLERVGMINEVTPQSLNLPFKIPDNISDSVLHYLAGEKPLSCFGAKPQNPNRHMIGVLRCASVISKTGMSVGELLHTPLTNKELRGLAGV